MFHYDYFLMMKIVNVEKRSVYITLDFPLEQVKQLVRFCEHSLPLFRRVHQGEEELANDIQGGVVDVLKNLVRTLENEP